MTGRTTFDTRPLRQLSVSDGRERCPRRRRERAAAAILVAVAFAAFSTPEAFALITGGEGNKSVADPGWPKGAAAIFNIKARIAWWEGPPFGGGQWHAECRGDAKAFNAVLADFARLNAKSKRVVLHDGIGQSFWLNPNREPAKEAAARIDWIFMVWQPASWEHLRKLPADLNPTDAAMPTRALRRSSTFTPAAMFAGPTSPSRQGSTSPTSVWKPTGSSWQTASYSKARSSISRLGGPSPHGCAWNGSSRSHRAATATMWQRRPQPTCKDDGP